MILTMRLVFEIIVEGLAVCFILFFPCAVGVSNGPGKFAIFYEKRIQDWVINHGLTTKKEIKRKSIICMAAIFLPLLTIIPAAVFFINGARSFAEIFWQITAVCYIGSAFDKVFMDYYWVGKTTTWDIPGTEQLKPYISKKNWVKKIISAIVWPPLMGVIYAFCLHIN